MQLATEQCSRGKKRKRRLLEEEELMESSERAFQAYGETFENVTAFSYLGRLMEEDDDDWLAVVGNHLKARKSWERLSQILSREGADPKVLRHFSRRRPRRSCCSGRRRGY